MLKELDEEIREVETNKEMSAIDKQECLENCKSLLRNIELEKPQTPKHRDTFLKLRERIVSLETRVGYSEE